MVKRFVLLLFLFLAILAVDIYAQGIAVSYLIPSNGYLSSPVSPFSVRGLRLPITGFAGIQGGFTLYNFPGLPVEGQAFDSSEPLRGNTLGVIVPAGLYVGGKIGSTQVILSGGAFGLFFFNDRMIEGNWDREYAAFRNWDIANGSLSLENKPGYGWIGGIEFEIPITRSWSLTLGSQYLYGKASSPITGDVVGSVGSGLIQEALNYDEAYTKLQGMELSLGVVF